MAKTRKNLLGLLQLAAQRIGERIVFLRGERVLLDADLATLYGVTTGALNRAVKRNHDRFPADFMCRRFAGEASFEMPNWHLKDRSLRPSLQRRSTTTPQTGPSAD